MRKTIRKTVLYQCSKCKTYHSSKKDAVQCEKRIREKKVFRVGDMVCNIEPHTCVNANCGRRKNYRFTGKVIKLIGPKPSDYEYEVKWLGGKSERLNSHVFQYDVAFTCPHCKEKLEHRYYAPELQALKAKR